MLSESRVMTPTAATEPPPLVKEAPSVSTYPREASETGASSGAAQDFRADKITTSPAALVGRRAAGAQPQEAAHAPAVRGSSTRPVNFARPAEALSVHVLTLFKTINARFCRMLRVEDPKYNNGFADKDGHYAAIVGEEILERYVVKEVLGKGSFGTVLKCFDHKRKEPVAMKITRCGTHFREMARQEIGILLKLNSSTSFHNLVAQILKVFDWQGHLVIVFELLSLNLYQLLRCTRTRGVSFDLVRKFGYQLLQTLDQLERHSPSIIHCDIKPENILLRQHNRSAICLIDFGSACYQNRPIFKYIQSRFYRSPEVILGLPYSTAIDRWSLGCVLVELHTASPLFCGRSEADQLGRFEAIIGPIPPHLVSASPKRNKFFHPTPDPVTGHYKLLPRPGEDETAASQIGLPAPLEQILGVRSGGPRGARAGTAGHDPEHYEMFLDLIQGLLCYDPAKRLRCKDALRHPFLMPIIERERQAALAAALQQEGPVTAANTTSVSTAVSTSCNNSTAFAPVPLQRLQHVDPQALDAGK